MTRIFIPFLSFIFLAGCASNQMLPSQSKGNRLDRVLSGEHQSIYVRGDNGGQAPMLKVATDRRTYRYVTLENDLPVILVSDPEAEYAAAAMRVDVGGGDDPWAFQGLSHFLEHMLFLGSKHYPSAGEFSQYISQNGGSGNAFTTYDSTSYFFYVQPDALKEGLDRFGDFFVSPLFDQRYVEREINAVDSEFHGRGDSDGVKIFEASKALYAKNHSAQKLIVGNRQTLLGGEDRAEAERIEQLQRALRSFFEKYYIASNMRLSVVGPQTLDQLQSYVADLQDIAKGESRDLSTADYEPALWSKLADPAKRQVLLVDTLRPAKQLSVQFIFPNIEHYQRSKAVAYIGGLLEHEGKQSLQAAYKREGLATDINLGAALYTREQAILSIDIQLEELGMREPARVVAMLYAALESVRTELQTRSGQARAQARYNEQRKLVEQQAYFSSPGREAATAMKLISALEYYPVQLSAIGAYWYEGFALGHVQQVLDNLIPSNSRIVVASDRLSDFFSGPEFSRDRRSQWYSASYTVVSQSELPDAMSYCWSSSRDCVHPFSPLMALNILTGPNPYIPSDFTIKNGLIADPDAKTGESNSSHSSSNIRDLELALRPAPEEQLSGAWGRIWFADDRYFLRPKGDIKILFRLPPRDSARLQVLAQLYIDYVAEQLEVEVYGASLAGLGYGLSEHRLGLQLEVSGFNDGMQKFIFNVVDVMQFQHVEAALFEGLKKQLYDGLLYQKLGSPMNLVYDALGQKINPEHFSYEDYKLALDSIGAHDLEKFAQELWQQLAIETLVHGNFLNSDVKEFAGALCDHLPCERPRKIWAQPQDYPVDAGHLQLHLDSEHEDSVSLWYLQASGNLLKDQVLTTLLGQMVEQHFFRQLRTEQQLGYNVQAGSRIDGENPGLIFLVQSSHFGVSEVSTAIEEWLNDLLVFDERGPISPGGFVDQKNAMRKRFAAPDASIASRSNLMWKSILRGELAFDRQRKVLDLLEVLSFKELRAFADKILSPQSRRLITIYADSAKTAGP